jgi:hypothetical protein
MTANGTTRIFGVDFTSRPSLRKPLVVVETRLTGDVVTIQHLHRWADPAYGDYRDLLASPGPWIAGIDHPFGLPGEFVRAVGWPARWERYVAAAARLDRSAFRDRVAAFRASQPSGSRHPRRTVDRVARAASPVNVVRPPVGLMWHVGAPLLAEAEIDVRPCRPMPDSDRVAVEVYPALLADRLIGHRRYKDARRGVAGEKEERTRARELLLRALLDPKGVAGYGKTVRLGPEINGEELVADPGGDLLDAVLCAVQAAWAASDAEGRYGVSTAAISDEGWIVDPSTLGA